MPEAYSWNRLCSMLFVRVRAVFISRLLNTVYRPVRGIVVSGNSITEYSALILLLSLPSHVRLFVGSSCGLVSKIHGISIGKCSALSAGVETAFFRHLVSDFSFRANLPGESCDPEDHEK